MFSHDDPMSPNPQVMVTDPTVSIVFTNRATNPGETRTLTVTFLYANIDTLTAVRMETGTPGDQDFILDSCTPQCDGASVGVDVSTEPADPNCITFDNVVLQRFDPMTGMPDATVTMSGSLGYVL